MFAERLNFIMELTGTKSSALGRASSLDASHVSRLRRGNRALPKNPTFLSAMSLYLARRVRTDYQKKSLCDVMALQTSWPADEDAGAVLIERWFSRKRGSLPELEPILKSFTGIVGKKVAEGPETVSKELALPRKFYFGPEGKREAVLQFFALVLREKTSQTLLLFSDEEMGWLYEDKDFADRWETEFKKVLKAGNRVRIVHTVSRNINEMLEAVTKWVPLYMTGMIEPYYYPKLRDGVFQCTRFIAPSTAAVISSAVAQKTAGGLNELITDPEALAALVREYENYLALCRPLMRILNANSNEEYWTMRRSLELAEGDSVRLSGLPTLATMPKEVADSMQARAPGSFIRKRRDESTAALERHLESWHHTELVKQPTENTIESIIPLSCADMLGAPGLCYTPSELCAHQDYLRSLADRFKNFCVINVKDVPGNLILYGKENRGIFMSKTDKPCVTFAFSEPNMTAAFWDYLVSKIQNA